MPGSHLNLYLVTTISLGRAGGLGIDFLGRIVGQ